MMGTDTAEQINAILKSGKESMSSVLASIFGSLILIIGTIGVFIELQKSLNKIWKVKAVPQNGIWLFKKVRLSNIFY